MKRIFAIIVVLSGFICGWAQQSLVTTPQNFSLQQESPSKFSQLKEFCKANDILNHWDVGFVAGTGGLGFEFSSPITNWVRMRLGYSWMPHSDVAMYFDLSNYGGSMSFKEMQKAVEKLLGFKIPKTVRMNGEPLAHHLRVLFDVYPWQDKKWRLTTGFLWGPNKIATACNDIDYMQLTLGVMLYNKAYDFVMNTDFIETPLFGDMYLDPEVGDMLKDKFTQFGYLGVKIGKYKDDGRPCILEPGPKGKVTANMFVNNFCPYVGGGYDINFGPENCLKLGLDFGILIWGGSPSIITQALKVDSKGEFILDDKGNRIKENVDLVRDVTNIKGRPGFYVDATRVLKVYPMLNVKLSYNLF